MLGSCFDHALIMLSSCRTTRSITSDPVRLRAKSSASCLSHPSIISDGDSGFTDRCLTERLVAGSLSHGHTSHHITSHHITSHHITSHHITSHHITHHTSHRIKSTGCPLSRAGSRAVFRAMREQQLSRFGAARVRCSRGTNELSDSSAEESSLDPINLLNLRGSAGFRPCRSAISHQCA